MVRGTRHDLCRGRSWGRSPWTVGGGTTGTHREGQARDEVDEESRRAPGATLRDPDRRHVTLENLTDLADLATLAGPAGGELPAISGNGRADPGFPLPVRAAWAQPAERWLLELLALVGASVAFVLPSVWLLIVATGCVLGGTVAFRASGRPLQRLPARVALRGLTLLHPRSSLWVPVLAARTVLAAVALPAGVAAAGWMIDEGQSGVPAAARAGAWAHGFRVAAVIVGFMLLTSVGDGRARRAAAVRRWAAPATDGTLSLLAITCCAMAALAIFAVPRPGDPLAGRADGLGWLPPSARAAADRVRDDIVTLELDTLASCLAKRTGTVWQTSYSSENAPTAPDVARLAAGSESVGDVATALVAAHNQLAPWVETIEVELPGGELLRTDRTTLPRHRPLADDRLLAEATSADGSWLSGGSFDRAAALRCSAGPVL